MSKGNSQRTPALSVLALLSFIFSFLIARGFTTFFPSIVVSRGVHFHHFWYGIILQAIGGWLGISQDEERINRLAAILFGAGGGLIVDEVGLLLTFGNYWSPITYAIVITLVVALYIGILTMRYSNVISKNISHYTRNNSSLYFGVFLAAVSIAFITRTNDVRASAISGLLVAIGAAMILAHFVQRLRNKH